MGCLTAREEGVMLARMIIAHHCETSADEEESTRSQQEQHTNRIARVPLDLGLLAGVHQAIRGMCVLPDAHPVIHTQHLVSMLHCSFRHQVVLEFLRALGPGSDGCSQLSELLN